MKRLMARTNAAKAHAAKRAAARKEKDAIYERREYLAGKVQQERARLDWLKDARKRRQEDYMLGPLAPRRDVGDMMERWGTIPEQLAQRVEVPEADLPKYFPYVAGDRVCLIEGYDKGKIGVVHSVYEESMSIIVEGLRQTEAFIEPNIRKVEGSKEPTRRINLPIPISDVRLVWSLTSPITGHMRDCIINEFKIETETETETGVEYPARRVVPGIPDLEIPYPRHDETEDAVDEPWDTLRIHTEEQTWVPHEMMYPMPSSVIDELRSKYSKTREVHDADYVAKKKAADAREEQKKNLHLLMQIQKAANAPKREALAEQVLERLGAELAKRRGFAGGKEKWLAKKEA
ncbi:hypothetical protein K490DRAFT_74818 [Saccharata proteae CBS 121410]|uniref:KOW domain-containing protein n=1 Tax=Saccharata proteae CBS 121410 TaxID=1314787 RepID=A0A9P4HT45_9PEZI|nr:hypothetical protein K490DRAFT_74818 [Saccharata proteae CBS 121410]